jgi:hypothetical protein
MERGRRRNATPHAKRRFYITHLKRKFGISEEYAAELADRRECDACGRKVPDEAAYRKLHVDHDHTTGEVRGVLCISCNHAIAALDDPLLRYLLEHYLELHRERQVT